jgi:hypothetical protein
MKTLYFIRHGKKTADGSHIVPEHLELIATSGIPSLMQEDESQINVIHLGTDMIRTTETVVSYAKYLANTYNSTNLKFIAPNKYLGSNALWSKMFGSDHPKYEAYFGSTDSFITTWKSRSTPEEFRMWQDYLIDLVKEIFGQMNDGDSGITINHTPQCEAIYCAISGDEDCPNFKELQGLKITLDDNDFTNFWSLPQKDIARDIMHVERLLAQ